MSMIGKLPAPAPHFVPPKPPLQQTPPVLLAQKSDVETVREIVQLALRDGKEIVVLVAVLRSKNEGGVNWKLSDGGAGYAGTAVQNALFTRLILMVTRAFAESREGDLHLGRAFELLTGDTLESFQRVGLPAEIAAAAEQWQKLRADQRLNSLSHFRDKQTAHLGVLKDSIPAAKYGDLFNVAEAAVDLIDRLAAGLGMAKVKIRDEIDAKPAAEAFWKPWKT
jgi:alkanesulfonate monooxygenase SsuD/methylene tetrahydromethanopterin reductase-like flavin-dependent oxidoreductase (luciferase family)